MLDGKAWIEKQTPPRPPKPTETIEMKDFSPVRPKQLCSHRARTVELVFIHEFAANCYEFLSAPSRAAMTAPSSASSTTGARCRCFAWAAAAAAAGVPAN